MTGTPIQIWDRHSILSEIKRRFGSMTAFAATTPLTVQHFSAALGGPYPKADRMIARALDVPVHQLWPDRYDPQGHRKGNSIAGPTRKASPNRAAAIDTEERA